MTNPDRRTYQSNLGGSGVGTVTNGHSVFGTTDQGSQTHPSPRRHHRRPPHHNRPNPRYPRRSPRRRRPWAGWWMAVAGPISGSPLLKQQINVWKAWNYTDGKQSSYKADQTIRKTKKGALKKSHTNRFSFNTPIYISIDQSINQSINRSTGKSFLFILENSEFKRISFSLAEIFKFNFTLNGGKLLNVPKLRSLRWLPLSGRRFDNDLLISYSFAISSAAFSCSSARLSSSKSVGLNVQQAGFVVFRRSKSCGEHGTTGFVSECLMSCWSTEKVRRSGEFFEPPAAAMGLKLDMMGESWAERMVRWLGRGDQFERV